MRYANIYIYIFVLHRGFFQQPRGRVAPRLGRRPPIRQTLPLQNAIFLIYLKRFHAFWGLSWWLNCKKKERSVNSNRRQKRKMVKKLTIQKGA